MLEQHQQLVSPIRVEGREVRRERNWVRGRVEQGWEGGRDGGTSQPHSRDRQPAMGALAFYPLKCGCRVKRPIAAGCGLPRGRGQSGNAAEPGSSSCHFGTAGALDAARLKIGLTTCSRNHKT